MAIGMRPEIMSILLQPLDQRSECRGSVKLPGKEEGGFRTILLQGRTYRLTSVGVLMSGEGKVDLLPGGVPPDDSPLVDCQM